MIQLAAWHQRNIPPSLQTHVLMATFKLMFFLIDIDVGWNYNVSFCFFAGDFANSMLLATRLGGREIKHHPCQID